MEIDFIELREAVSIASDAINRDIQARELLILSLEGRFDLYLKTLKCIKAYETKYYTLEELNSFQEVLTLYNDLCNKKTEELESARRIVRTCYTDRLKKLALGIDSETIETAEQQEALEVCRKHEESVEAVEALLTGHELMHPVFAKYKIDGGRYICLPIENRGCVGEFLPSNRDGFYEKIRLKNIDLSRGVYKIWNHPDIQAGLIFEIIERIDESGKFNLSKWDRFWALFEFEGQILATTEAAAPTTILGTSRQSLQQFIASKKAPAVDLDPREVKSLGQVMNVLVQLSGVNLAEPYVAAKQLREEAALLDMPLPESDETLLKWLAIGQTDKPSGRKRTRKKIS